VILQFPQKLILTVGSKCSNLRLCTAVTQQLYCLETSNLAPTVTSRILYVGLCWGWIVFLNKELAALPPVLVLCWFVPKRLQASIDECWRAAVGWGTSKIGSLWCFVPWLHSSPIHCSVVCKVKLFGSARMSKFAVLNECRIFWVSVQSLHYTTISP
jgi:hypothetical protein